VQCIGGNCLNGNFLRQRHQLPKILVLTTERGTVAESMEPKPAATTSPESLSLGDLKTALSPLPDGGAKVEALLSSLWETQRSALLRFASEGGFGDESRSSSSEWKQGFKFAWAP
jgi:hypothetical protein